MTRTIPNTIAGDFYPADPRELESRVRGFLSAAGAANAGRAGAPVAIIAPHAGYDYSGAVAGAAYALLMPAAAAAQCVLLMGTWHQRGARGLAATSADAFSTPLGSVPIDRAGVERAAELLGDRLVVDDRAHAFDHALQVQLPLLQVALGQFSVVPLLVGAGAAEDVAELVVQHVEIAGGPVVVSSDLSHFHDDASARQIDEHTAQAIVRLDADAIGPEQACGRTAIASLIVAARRLGWTARVVDLRNSGDTTGGRERVVGYGAFAFEQPATPQ